MPRYALTDPADAWPRPVRGYYDTGAFDYPSLPPAGRLTEMSDDAWGRRVLGPLCLAEDGTFVDAPEVPPTPVARTLPPLEFMGRFTPAESEALAQAAQSNASILLWMLRLSAAREVDLDDAQTIAGLDALVSAGLLTAAGKRAALA